MPIYSDINSVNPTTKPLLTDVQDVYQSLYNLFNTRPGDRLFLPDFGFKLEDQLFEVIDDITAVSVFRAVDEAISQWEARVLIDASRTKVTPVPDANRYDLELYFSIQGITDQTFLYQGSFTSS